MTVYLPGAEYEKLLLHAEACLPEEACGLIGGLREEQSKHIRKVYLLENADHSPEHFSIAPGEQLSAVRDMRRNGWEPLGNWHSHPATPSRPSEEDRRLAYDAKASYLILSLAGPEPELRSFRVADGAAEQETLIIE